MNWLTKLLPGLARQPAQPPQRSIAAAPVRHNYMECGGADEDYRPAVTNGRAG